MECHVCGADVTEGQKFCHECGASLKGVTDATEQLDTVAPAATPATDADAPPEPEPAVEPEPEPAVESAIEQEPEPEAEPEPEPEAEPEPEPAVESAIEPEPELPSLSDLPTEEIEPRPPLPDPTWADPAAAAEPTELFDDLTTPTPAHPTPAIDATDDTPATTTLPALDADDDAATATTTLEAVPAADDHDIAERTTVIAATAGAATDEYPAAVFDGSGDVHEYPEQREPFQLRLIFVIAFFGAIAVLMSSAADMTDIRTSIPVDGIDIGISKLDDVGVNLPVAGFIGGVVMALGALLACFGFRWGAGLAGGAGMALAGWSALTIGLVEVPIARAESLTRTSPLAFTLRVTRDLGYWLVVAVGIVGAIVFAISLRSAGTGGRRSLNPWVGAVGAVGAVVLAAGPMIPVGDAVFADNFRSTNALIDLPSAFFGGRLAQVALIAIAGVLGFLLVRAYGLGLAAGGISVAVWMWLSSLLRIGEDDVTGEQPLGIAATNIGADDTTPHGVTTVGMSITLVMLVVAAALAVVQHRRASR